MEGKCWETWGKINWGKTLKIQQYKKNHYSPP